MYCVESSERAKSLSGVWRLGSSFTSQAADPGRMETGLGRLTRNMLLTLWRSGEPELPLQGKWHLTPRWPPQRYLQSLEPGYGMGIWGRMSKVREHTISVPKNVAQSQVSVPSPGSVSQRCFKDLEIQGIAVDLVHQSLMVKSYCWRHHRIWKNQVSTS